MAITFESIENRKPSRFELSCMTLTLVGFVYVLVYYLRWDVSHAAPSERAFIGPLCGGTRSMACVLEGRIWDAIVFSPLSVLFATLLFTISVNYLVLVCAFQRRLKLTFGRGFWGLCALSICAGWVYALYSGAYLVPFR